MISESPPPSQHSVGEVMGKGASAQAGIIHEDIKCSSNVFYIWGHVPGNITK